MLPRERSTDIAVGKWRGLLGQWLDARALAGKHTKCPMCGGKDRFRMDDKGGRGTWICSHCGAGDGIALLQNLNGWTFIEAAKYVDQNVGRIQSVEVRQQMSSEDARQSLRRVWGEAEPVKEGDPVWLYLKRRCGIAAVPKAIRYHAQLAYLHEDGTRTYHPAMVAQIVGQDGKGQSIHRTYLDAAGQKAAVPSVKRLMTPVEKLGNSAVRLGKPEDGYLGIAEGIETALSAAQRFAVPVWAATTAGLMREFVPPEDVRALLICGDNDASFTGQAAAFELARRLTNKGVECKVVIPEIVGADWADMDPPTATERRAKDFE